MAGMPTFVGPQRGAMTTYATVAELKAQIDPSGTQVTFTDDDNANLDLCLEAATEWIKERTGLNFEATTATKYYTADDANLLFIDDLLSVTTLKTDDDADGTYETTWTTTDYILDPVNASPKRLVKVNPNTGDYYFPVEVANGVQIIGSWGTTSSIPNRIKVACLLIAHRLWKRHETLFGIASQGMLSLMVIKAKVTEDSDVVALLDMADYRRPW